MTTVEEISRGLTSWHVHKAKGRRELERIADEQGVERMALFSAAVRIHDRVQPQLDDPTPAPRRPRRAATGQTELF